MAYGDNVDPKNRVVAIVLVGLFTAVLGYGLVNGLNISIVKKIAEKLDVVDVEEPPPPEEPPPEVESVMRMIIFFSTITLVSALTAAQIRVIVPS